MYMLNYDENSSINNRISYTQTSQSGKILINLDFGEIIYPSTIDWPGKVSLVVFTRGCPFNCIYCCNSKFLDKDESNYKEIAYIENIISKNSVFLDAVVFSGGEPFEQHIAICMITQFVKKLKLQVGIHTNGAYPDRIRQMIESGSVDAIFLDVKAPFINERYNNIACPSQLYPKDKLIENIRASLDICCKARVENKLKFLEVRSTIFRDINSKLDDIKNMVEPIGYCDAYVLQQGRTEIAMDNKMDDEQIVTRNELLEIAKFVRRLIPFEKIKVVKVRTRELGDEIIP